MRCFLKSLSFSHTLIFYEFLERSSCSVSQNEHFQAAFNLAYLWPVIRRLSLEQLQELSPFGSLHWDMLQTYD